MLYEDLLKIDILTPLLRGFHEGRFKMLRNGRIKWSTLSCIEPETPWMFAQVSKERKCSKWLDIYHYLYNIIPRECRGCWKVVYKPKTLSEMKKVYKLQIEMGLPAKSGVETRPYTGNKGGYNCFWYAPLDGGLKQARELYEVVRTKVRALLGDKQVILKRGCTEMEQFGVRVGIGKSDQWDLYAERWDLLQDLLDATFIDNKIKEEPETKIMKIHTEKTWIEWAFEHGDETWKEFADEKSFSLPLLNYGDSSHKNRDFKYGK